MTEEENVQQDTTGLIRLNIGLVDDHVMLRRGLAAMLESEGLNIVLQADHGRHLVAQWDTLPILPQLILLDVNMPVMDGYETARWLKQHAPGVKILALSVIDNVEAIRKMIASGADGYTLKDVHPKMLVNAIRMVYEKGFFISDQLDKQLIAGM